MNGPTRQHRQIIDSQLTHHAGFVIVDRVWAAFEYQRGFFDGASQGNQAQNALFRIGQVQFGIEVLLSVRPMITSHILGTQCDWTSKTALPLPANASH